jgi:hypothetical protein
MAGRSATVPLSADPGAPALCLLPAPPQPADQTTAGSPRRAADEQSVTTTDSRGTGASRDERGGGRAGSVARARGCRTHGQLNA